MSSVPDGQIFDAKLYQRPNQEWLCGHLAEGCPCPIGPSGRGECQVSQVCLPLKSGDAWVCGRAKAWGGRCAEGPVPDVNAPDQQAVCPHAIPPCQPRRSLRSKRRLLSGVVVVASLGFCLVLLGGSSGRSGSPLLNTTSLISPGELTARHNTIQQGCSACHSAAVDSPGNHLTSAFGGVSDVSESDKCLTCHEDVLGSFALHAHGMNPDLLAAATKKQQASPQNTLRQTLARVVPEHKSTSAGELACASCHKEHRGRDFDLKRITNEQCQICHTSSFHSLQDGHPDFEIPKHDTPSHLLFDHLTHYRVHFAADEGAWLADSPNDTCSKCHSLDDAGRSMTVTDFDNSCAACHLNEIKADPQPLLRLPGVPFLTLTESDLLPPDAAPTDTPDENVEAPSVPPVMRLLLQADEQFAGAMAVLKEASGEGDDDPQANAARAQAVRTLTIARRELIADLVLHREAAVRGRLQRSFNDADPAMIDAAAEALVGIGFFDKLAELQHPHDGAAESRVNHASSWDTVPVTSGGSDVFLVYYSQKHADQILRSWLDLAAAQARSTKPPDAALSSAADQLLASLTQPQTTGRCIKCHTVLPKSGHFVVNWRPRESKPHGFTKFAHSPHVTLLNREGQVRSVEPFGDRRCESCHHIQRDHLDFAITGLPTIGGAAPLPHAFSNSVESMSIATCVECHTPQAAGNDCLKCHNYHVGEPGHP